MVELHFLVRTLFWIKGESDEWYEPEEMDGYTKPFRSQPQCGTCHQRCSRRYGDVLFPAGGKMKLETR
jgi:hypothetical protein